MNDEDDNYDSNNNDKLQGQWQKHDDDSVVIKSKHNEHDK